VLPPRLATALTRFHTVLGGGGEEILHVHAKFIRGVGTYVFPEEYPPDSFRQLLKKKEMVVV
jgi:hypothetical protein